MPPHNHNQNQQQGRPSSRRALTRALELAQEAVRIDATGEDPHGAVYAYAKSVALLNEVMERVMRGEDTESSRRRNSTRRTAVAREDEARRLRSIHDTYYDRMQILVMIYGIPQPDLGSSSLGSPTAMPSFPQPPQPRAELPAAPRPPSEEVHPSYEGIAAALMLGADDAGAPSTGVTHNHPLPPRSHPPPPSRQQPLAPVVNRPRSDSSARRQQAQAARPPHPPPVAPPLPAAPSYSRPSSATDHYRQTQPFPRDVRLDAHGRPVDDGVDLYDDWDEDLDPERERQEEEEIRRAYPPPPVTAPRRRNTSGSSANHHLYIPQEPQPDHRDSFFGHTQPSNSASYVVEELPAPLSSSRPPTPAKRPRGNTQSSIISGQSEESSVYSERPITPPPIPAVSAPAPTLPHLVSNSTAQGTISQRRKAGEVGPVSLDVHPAPPLSRSHSPATDASTISQASQRALPSLPNNLGVAGRHRAVSQPGRRPSIIGLQHGTSSSDHDHVPSVPPLPQSALPRKTSFTTAPSRNQESPAFSLPSLITTSGTPPTPGTYFTPATSTGSNFANGGGVALPPVPNSPLPPVPPIDTVRRPYHLMSLLHTSIVTPTGGYITRKLHVPHDVWTQGGAKLTNLVEKGKCIAVVQQGLDDLSKASHEFLRAPPQINPAFARAVGDRWVRALDEWIGVCEGIIVNMGKKLGMNEGMTAKKNTGWTKVTRTFEKMTNAKNLDSPTIYVQNLANLFGEAQMFDEHHQLMVASSGSYQPLPSDVRSQIEARLKRSSEFFANVIIDFVIRDLGQLLDKYAKKGEKWMEE